MKLKTMSTSVSVLAQAHTSVKGTRCDDFEVDAWRDMGIYYWYDTAPAVFGQNIPN